MFSFPVDHLAWSILKTVTSDNLLVLLVIMQPLILLNFKYLCCQYSQPALDNSQIVISVWGILTYPTASLPRPIFSQMHIPFLLIAIKKILEIYKILPYLPRVNEYMVQHGSDSPQFQHPTMCKKEARFKKQKNIQKPQLQERLRACKSLMLVQTFTLFRQIQTQSVCTFILFSISQVADCTPIYLFAAIQCNKISWLCMEF